MDDVFKCMFCDQPISTLSNHFFQERNGVVRAGHMKCEGIDTLIEEWGLAVRLQKISDQYLGD